MGRRHGRRNAIVRPGAGRRVGARIYRRHRSGRGVGPCPQRRRAGAQGHVFRRTGRHAGPDRRRARRQPREILRDRPGQFGQHPNRRRHRRGRRHRNAQILRLYRRPAWRRQIPQGRGARAAGQGSGLSGHASPGAPERRGRAHQRLQFPLLGALGKSGRGPIGRRPRSRQAGDGDGALVLRDGQGRGRGRRRAAGRLVPHLRQRPRSHEPRRGRRRGRPSPDPPRRRTCCAAMPT